MVDDDSSVDHKYDSMDPIRMEMFQMSSCRLPCFFRRGDRPMLVTANAGDSRAVLCRNGVAVPLSKDHKPGLKGETERILKAGGKVREIHSLSTAPLFCIDHSYSMIFLHHTSHCRRL